MFNTLEHINISQNTRNLVLCYFFKFQFISVKYPKFLNRPFLIKLGRVNSAKNFSLSSLEVQSRSHARQGDCSYPGVQNMGFYGPKKSFLWFSMVPKNIFMVSKKGLQRRHPASDLHYFCLDLLS